MAPTQPPARDAAQGFRLVALGGGTGLSTLLKGLKKYVPAPGVVPAQGAYITDLSAIVTVTDDGGSSGRLRKEFNILPPGDIRNCMVAVAEDETLLSKLFQYRFPGGSGSGLEGHSFGNLFLTAMAAVTGDFAEAVKLSAGVLASRGHIYPATTANVQLEALMTDGTRVHGETNITASEGRIAELRLAPADAQPLPEAIAAIERADLITVGPGSLFTSLVTNMLVRAIPEAIARSRAVKVFVCNLMTQANESLGLTASEHIKAIREHAPQMVFDYALVNDAYLSDHLKAKYALEGASQIVGDVEAIEALGVRTVMGDFLEEGPVARHATERVARTLLDLAAGTLGPQASASEAVRSALT
ncbi:MAG TPA: gluconeogenesis factor YvcK family protein [Terriglobales bacterium]|nr:gluconeogenesis factor YvcK family protein [Terriglobales bacterium]